MFCESVRLRSFVYDRKCVALLVAAAVLAERPDFRIDSNDHSQSNIDSAQSNNNQTTNDVRNAHRLCLSFHALASRSRWQKIKVNAMTQCDLTLDDNFFVCLFVFYVMSCLSESSSAFVAMRAFEFAYFCDRS